MKYLNPLSVAVALCHIGCASAASANEEPADSITRQLQEVVVSARQPATRLEGSALVSTITGSHLAELGNAFDVLAQLPMIKVEDKTVSVVGKGNVAIYIDGRPMRDSEELALLRSSNMAKVELLLAPGAMYESTTGAVIRITTRRRFVQGLSVTDQFQLQRRRRWSAMDFLSADYRTGNWNFFAEGTFNHDSPVIKGTTVNRLQYEGLPVEIGSSQNKRVMTNNAVARIGFSYSTGSRSVGGYYRFGPEYGRFTNSGAEWFGSDALLARDINRHITSRSHLVAMYYDDMLADRYHLHFDGDFRTSRARASVATEYPGGNYDPVCSSEHKRSDLGAAKLYVESPLLKGNLSVGAQGSYTRTSLDYRMLNDRVSEYIPSALTESRQVSAALFASWSRSFGRLNLTGGVRYEYIDYGFTVDGVRDTDVSRRDHLLTPDVSLGYSFGDRAQLSLSYKMVTVRPPYAQLTGSLNYVGLHEIEGGNTALRDERMHDLQLFGMWGDFMLQADLTRSLDTYAFVKERYAAPALQLMLHPVNVDVSALSVYLMWNRTVRAWTPDVTVGIYAQRLELGGTPCKKPLLSYYFNNTIALPRDFVITANITGTGSGYMHTNRFRASWFSMDVSVGKSFLNKSLMVKLSATDLFNTACNDWSMLTYGVAVDKRQSYDRRGISLGITYRFQPRKRQYKGEAASQSELNRL